MKLTPNGRVVRARVSSINRLRESGVIPTRVVPSMPNPPASETAAASSGAAIPPIAACCMGTVQPINTVKRVGSIAGYYRARLVRGQ